MRVGPSRLLTEIKASTAYIFHYFKRMPDPNSKELRLLTQRIVELRRAIGDAQARDSWRRAEQPRIIALLEETLNALEVRKAELENSYR